MINFLAGRSRMPRPFDDVSARHGRVLPPLPLHQLDRLRLDLRKSVPHHGFGAHARRKLGHSLEFREYKDYAPGDDIRSVDWRASLRKGRIGDWVSRSYEAEERLTMAILIDAGPTTWLPQGGFEKLRVACWIMQCLAHVAAAEHDGVLLSTMFRRGGDQEILSGSGPAAVREASRLAKALLTDPPGDADWIAAPEFDSRAIIAKLPPAAVVVIISDFYFDATRSVERLVRKAQAGYRQLSIVRLDSWPMERALLAAGPVKLRPLARWSFGNELLEASDVELKEIDVKIRSHLQALRSRWNRGGLVWPRNLPFSWPGSSSITEAEFAEHFCRHFRTAAFLPALLARR